MFYSRQISALIGLLLCVSISCTNNQKTDPVAMAESIDFLRGELALCGVPDFGKVNFGLTCTNEVQKDFTIAIALLHSFEYKEAEKAFVRVIDADPQCAIGYWGVAMSNLHELWAPPTKKELDKCSKILEIARSLPTKSEKEAEYIDAISTYFYDYENLGHQQRADRYSEKMKALYLKYPEDNEAAVFYALALNGTADPADKTYKKQKEAGRILNEIFPDQPDHPGVAHYLIHNYDYPELAERGLEAARSYANIAPSSAHAQHMPSHIFTRLGLWDESISSNIRSADAAVCYAENMEMKGSWAQETHALDYLMYAYLQIGEEDKAGELLAYVNSIKPATQDHFADAYAFAAMPSRYALEQYNWEEAAVVKFHPDDYNWAAYPWERGIVHFTRILGAAHTGNLDKANAELEELRQCLLELEEKQDAYKSGQVSIQIKAGQAWIAYAEGRKDEALELMQSSADAEDATGKHPVTPGEVLPARELLADMLLDMGRYEEALAEYQASLKRSPNRYHSIAGAMKAVEAIGLEEMVDYFQNQLVSLRAMSVSES